MAELLPLIKNFIRNVANNFCYTIVRRQETLCLDTFMFREEISSAPKYDMTRFIGNVIHRLVTDFSNFNSSYIFLC